MAEILTKMNEDIFLTPKDIEKRLQMSHATVWKIMNLPDFPKIKIGKSVRVRESDFNKFIDVYMGNKIVLE